MTPPNSAFSQTAMKQALTPRFTTPFAPNTSASEHLTGAQHGMAALRTEHFPARAKLALRLLERIQCGSLWVTCPDGQQALFGAQHSLGDEPHAQIVFHDWKVCDAALHSGDIGFAQSYIAGDWETNDLTTLLSLFIVNRTVIENFIYGTWWGRLVYRVRHLLNRNSKAGSRRNIHAHYDIGNAFYQLWLDPSMTYSSALFNGDLEQDLRNAQHAKYARMLAETGVQAGEHLLEVGCGWGGMAETAQQAGVHLTGLTLSTEQADYARQRLASRHTADSGRTEIRLQDYRDVTPPAGGFDGIVSIEMFEAVGEAWWPSYFAALARNLKHGGKACIQTITIDDKLFARYRESTDFIQQYIFPGGMLPSPTVFAEQAAKAGLKVVNRLAFGKDYAETLKRWRLDFVAQDAAIRSQHFDDAFMRTWLFYLCYCEAAFAHANTDVMQFTLMHADAT